jgi:large subunit ribosomal protein L13
MITMKVVDAEGLIMGRMATQVAKMLLNGEDVVVTNAEKAVITGSKDHIMENYWGKRKLTHQRKGPFFPRQPHLIVKRTVRGMLPYQTPHGREALKRLIVHIGVPAGLKGKPVELKGASSEGKTRFMLVGDVSRQLGAKF